MLKISFFPKFTISMSCFSQNSHLQSLIFHKTHIFQTSNFWGGNVQISQRSSKKLNFFQASIVEAGGGPKGHVHHASGSSEDSSTDDVLCPPHHHQAAVSNSNGVKFAADEETIQCCHNPDNSSSSSEVSNLIKHASISDDHLLQDRKTRQVFISPFSTSIVMTLQHSLILRSCIF